jgi:hypothetical protein
MVRYEEWIKPYQQTVIVRECESAGVGGVHSSKDGPSQGLSKIINIFKYILIISEYYNTIQHGHIHHPSAYP